MLQVLIVLKCPPSVKGKESKNLWIEWIHFAVVRQPCSQHKFKTTKILCLCNMEWACCSLWIYI
jgi:hypothetical protein